MPSLGKLPKQRTADFEEKTVTGAAGLLMSSVRSFVSIPIYARLPVPVANLADDAAFFVVPGASGTPATEWVLARKGNLVVGIGDESFALKADLPLDKQADVRLGKDDKVAKLRALLVK